MTTSIQARFSQHIKDKSGFLNQTFPAGVKAKGVFTEITFHGLRLSPSVSGYTTQIIGDLVMIQSMPSALLDEVRLYTIKDTAPLHPIRTRGIYRLASISSREAEATVDRNECTHTIDISGTDIQKMFELYHAILAGTLAPAESWDDPQVPSSPSVSDAGGVLREADFRSLDTRFDRVEGRLRRLEGEVTNLAKPWYQRDRLVQAARKRLEHAGRELVGFTAELFERATSRH